MDDRRVRLDAAIKQRDALRDQVGRIKGRLDSARAELDTVEKECREKGIDPSQLETAIQKLSGRCDQALADLEAKMLEANTAIQPFLGKD